MVPNLPTIPTTMKELNLNNTVEEVNDLLTFLQDFEVRSPSAIRAPSPTHKKLPPRRPLAALRPNRLENNLPPDMDDESLSTCPSIPAKHAARRTWVTRMSQALRDWKKKHEQLTEQRLTELRQQLEAKHAQELRDLRQQIQQHYKEAFESWKKNHLQSLSTGTALGGPEPRPRPFGPRMDNNPSSSPSRGNKPQSTQRVHWKSPEGKRITHYENGTWLEQSPDGSSVTRFANGDVQTTGGTEYNSPTKLCYYYGHAKTLRMDQEDGSVIWCFPHGQRECHYPDGRVQVLEWAATEHVEGGRENV